MHDFCFTIPYGFAVLAGGVLGYLRRGSTASLAGGAGAGASTGRERLMTSAMVD